MSSKVKVGCVECGGPCTKYKYRCPSCGHSERQAFDKVIGRSKARVEAAAHKRAEIALQRLADIDADLALGIEPDRIAADQQTTRNALEKLAWRHGRNDLAAVFRVTGHVTDRRTGACVSCGGTCRTESERCVGCWTRWVRGDAA